MTEALVLEGIRKSFGDLEVLKGVDLSVNEHQVICLIGASGSGKSTLLRCINLVEPIGWEIGIIRVENVALGAAAGVLIGLAAWPRGATGQLAQSLADAQGHGKFRARLRQQFDFVIARLLTHVIADERLSGAGDPARDAFYADSESHAARLHQMRRWTVGLL